MLREPLLHFLALGALLFAAYDFVAGPGEGSRDEIVVTRARIESLAAVFERTWQRPPSESELEGSIQSWIREEVLYREGLALGLDRDDPVIRNRVGMKLEFLGEGSEALEPSDAELEAWLAAHAQDYALEPRFDLEQIYFDPARRGDALERDVARALEELRGRDPADPATLGDATLLPASLRDAGTSEIERSFGPQLAVAISELAPDAWQGPLPSTYGLHLVRVTKRSEGRTPTLAEARDVVARDWQQARTSEARERHYRSLRERYEVTIEPERGSGTPVTAAR